MEYNSNTASHHAPGVGTMPVGNTTNTLPVPGLPLHPHGSTTIFNMPPAGGGVLSPL